MGRTAEAWIMAKCKVIYKLRKKYYGAWKHKKAWSSLKDNSGEQLKPHFRLKKKPLKTFEQVQNISLSEYRLKSNFLKGKGLTTRATYFSKS